MNGANKKLELILHFLLFFVWILNGGSALAVLQKNAVLIVLLLLLFALFILSKKKIKQAVINCYLFTLIIVFLCIMIDYVFSIKPQDISRYIYIACEFIIQGLFCVYIYSVFTYEKFLEYFYKILKFIRWHAVISAIVMAAFPFLLSMKVGNSFNDYSAQSFLYIFYKVSDQYTFNFFGLSLTRNQGLFWEPGVLQFYLNMFLFFQLYIFKSKKTDLALTFFAIISTYSTSAYLVMIIVLSSYLIKRIRKSPVIVIPILLVAVLFFIPLLESNLQNKLSGDRQNSSTVRFYDLIQQVFVIKSNFLTGVGLDDEQYVKIRAQYGMPESLQELLGYNDLERGSSNSVLFILAALGIFMGGLWLYAYTRQNLVKEKKMLLTIILVFCVMVEPLLLKPFFITFIVSGFMEIGSNLKNIGNGKLFAEQLGKPRKSQSLATKTELLQEV